MQDRVAWISFFDLCSSTRLQQSRLLCRSFYWISHLGLDTTSILHFQMATSEVEIETPTVEIDGDVILLRAQHWQKSDREELKVYMDVIQSTFNDGEYDFVHSLCSALLEREVPMFHRARLETFMAIVQPDDSEVDAEECLDMATYWLIQTDEKVEELGVEAPGITEWEEKIHELRSQLEPRVETVEYTIDSHERKFIDNNSLS